MLTQHWLSFIVLFFLIGGFIDLHCCNYCHLPTGFSSNCQSPVTKFHQKLLTREGRALANGKLIHHPWQHLFTCSWEMSSIKSHSDIIYHMTLNIIFSVKKPILNSPTQLFVYGNYNIKNTWDDFVVIFFFFFETEGRHANAKAQEVIGHLARFPSSGEEISRMEIKLPTSSLRFGYLSTIIQQFRVISDQICVNSHKPMVSPPLLYK